MQPSKQHQILVVDDAKENIEILFALLQDQYKMVAAVSGEKALKKAVKLKPDLILLDILMPEMDGYEVCRRLKSRPETRDIPVIFVSAMSETGDETKGLELGAVDYLTKPVSPPIVKARVKNILRLRDSILHLHAAMQELRRLNQLALDANPMTKLPGNNSVTSRIEQAVSQDEATCVIYADLDNFKAYNDKYGFALGDEVIRFTCDVLKDAIRGLGLSDTFIGHIGGDDFVLLVPSIQAWPTAKAIMQAFDTGIPQFYKPEDVEAQCITSVNRQGERQSFPLISISLAGIDLAFNRYKNHLEVNDACAEAKKKAKASPGSSFFMDRRKSQ